MLEAVQAIPQLGKELLTGHHGDHEQAKSSMGLWAIFLLNFRDNLQAVKAWWNKKKWRHCFGKCC